jgi:hypothetical protein
MPAAIQIAVLGFNGNGNMHLSPVTTHPVGAILYTILASISSTDRSEMDRFL